MLEKESYTFRITASKRKELFIAADETGMNSASIMRKILYEWLENRKQQKTA
jgi:hypothetical protein